MSNSIQYIIDFIKLLFKIPVKVVDKPESPIHHINKPIIIIEEPPQIKIMNIQKLKGYIPQIVLDQLPDTIAEFKINTPLRLSHFLSQCAHESANFTVVKENLNYSAKGFTYYV